MRFLRALVVLLLVLPASALSAAPSERTLGHVEMTVADRSGTERREALRQGLDRVLIRLTGSAQPAEMPSLDPVRRGEPARWVSQYSYAEESPDREGAEADAETQIMLRARFDVDALLERLGSLNAPVWDDNRPAVLVWLVVQEPTSGELLARDSDHRVRSLLEDAAHHRGLPIVLPRMDSADRSSIQAADIRGRFDEPVKAASANYDAPLVVTAVLYTGDSPRLRWRLLDGGEEQIGDTLRFGALDEGLEDWVDRITDYLVDLYAVRGDQARTIRIRVEDLDQLPDWNELQNFLAGLAGMRSIELQHLNGATARFEARFAGSAQRLERLAKLQPGLSSCDDDRALAAVSAGVEAGSGNPRTDESDPAGPSGTSGQTGESSDSGQAGSAVSTLEFCWRGSD